MALTRPTARQLESTTVDFTDPLMRLNRAQSGANDKDIGIIFERGTDTNVAVIWDESTDQVAVITTNETGTTAGNVSIIGYANFSAGTITTSAIDTATTASHYFVETASDGAIRPKTLANARTEIVTTAAVNAAAATTVGTITSGTWNGSVISATYGGTGLSSLGTGVATFLGTPSSANLISAITDETGSGALVFGTSPAITTSITTGSASFDVFNTNATTVNAFGAATTLAIGNTATAAQTINMFTASTGASTYNFATGATATATTKTLNIGTGGAAGSTTNVNIGSSIGGTTTVNSGTLVGAATTQNVFNATATTVNAFGAATTLSIGNTATAAQTINMFTASTGASTYNLATGATATATTKTVNLGTGGAAGSTTNVNIGSGVAGTTTISSPNITIAGLADTATTATHYYVETASGNILPKTLANARTEIVTTAAVNAAAATTVGTVTSGTWNATAITDTYLATISTAGKVSNSATTATSANTANAIVTRDASGNFTAGTITATSFSGSGAGLTGITASPGGSNTQIQFNSSGSLAGNANLTYNGTTLTLSGNSAFSNGLFTFTMPAGSLGSTAGSVNTLQIFQATGNTDAFQSFHVNGDYAVHFGLDGTTNDLFVGGWSLGAVKHKVWHAGNDGTGSGLDADTVDGFNPATTNTGNTIVLRDASGNFSAGVITATATSARYADLAENFLADKLYPIGTVLMVGGSAEITIAVKDSSPVIGTVSENPAYLMNSSLTGDYVTPVAYVGRVPCRVVGYIRKGTRLILSNIPGVACAALSNNEIDYQAVGIALQDYDSNIEGLIEILVGR